ncbi:Carbonic anhydrase 6 [Liparis tanakae]|uniref:Carbonic anhydrase 6 n=1 Tax=Liparis tanakae TaxID=230148 RepID=A0A4Z2IY99_9TELE|nr:Carbonic anhydrase 6 [Liparis tanakae]
MTICASATAIGEGALDQVHWPTKYPECGGEKQSPIDIQRRSVKHNPDMLQLELEGYDAQKGNFLMANNGHTVQIDLPPTMAIIKGLPGKYTAVQMHLHWGGWDLEASGAEHTLDGTRYMAEIRKLESTLMDMDNKTLWNDYRMAQPLNSRVVESSFLPRLGKGTFCRQDEIESRLLKIEGLITSLGKHMHSGGLRNSKPTRYEPRALFPLVLDFQEKNSGSYALAQLSHPMELDSFTVCMHVLPQLKGVHTIISYASNGNDNELMISIAEDKDTREVGLWIGNEFINLPHNFKFHDWANYCITWSSHTGGADLWINGMVGEQRYLKRGYTVGTGGVFIVGKDQDGLLGISNADTFVGKMTDVNVWDYVLSTADIRDQMLCERNSTVVGNVFSWGTTKLSLFGGVQLDSQYRCL